MIILCCAMTVGAISSVSYAWQAMLGHIVTILGIRQSQTPNDEHNGAVDDTVLSKITTKRSFTVLWHLSEPPSTRFYLGNGQCEKRGGSLILWSVSHKTVGAFSYVSLNELYEISKEYYKTTSNSTRHIMQTSRKRSTFLQFLLHFFSLVMYCLICTYSTFFRLLVLLAFSSLFLLFWHYNLLISFFFWHLFNGMFSLYYLHFPFYYSFFFSLFLFGLLLILKQTGMPINILGTGV